MVSLGFSPCPNDTFIFYGLVSKKIATDGLEFSPSIEDVDKLNDFAMRSALDVTKVSCHMFYYVRDEYQFLRSGAAFGKGCGPLLVTRKGSPILASGRPLHELTVAVPGRYTTASLLLHLYFNELYNVRGSQFTFMPYNEIMPAVSKGTVDAGLIIHEGRFTYQEYGLDKVVDLGEWWEQETGLLLPLGGIIAKKSLGATTIKRIEGLIARSLGYAAAHPYEAMLYCRQYAQELSESVISNHIGLYVNEYSSDIGEEGLFALEELLAKAQEIF